MKTYEIESEAGIHFGCYEAESRIDALNMLYAEAGYDYTDNPPPVGYLVVTEVTSACDPYEVGDLADIVEPY